MKPQNDLEWEQALNHRGNCLGKQPGKILGKKSNLPVKESYISVGPGIGETPTQAAQHRNIMLENSINSEIRTNSPACW